MRKWTTSVCVVLAWSIIMPLLAAAGPASPGRPAQAITSTASITRTTLASTPGTARATLADKPAATWTVRPGDSLSAIAAALGVPGGWQALYAANRQAIGPNPNVIRPGTVLAARGQTPPRGQTPRPGTSTPGRPGYEAPPPTPAASPRPSSHVTAPANNPGAATASAGGMPQWLEDVLLAAGLLAVTAFAAELVTALARRRRRQAGKPTRPPANTGKGDPVQWAATRAKIILADHERLIVTYSIQDDTVYVLTPPGEDPRAVLRAARLVLPENSYEDLADHLGVPSAWPHE